MSMSFDTIPQSLTNVDLTTHHSKSPSRVSDINYAEWKFELRAWSEQRENRSIGGMTVYLNEWKTCQRTFERSRGTICRTTLSSLSSDAINKGSNVAIRIGQVKSSGH